MDQDRKVVISRIRLVVDELIEGLACVFDEGAEVTDLMIVKAVMGVKSDEEIADMIVSSILPFSKQISVHDHAFFVNNAMDIFSGLPTGRVTYFRDEIARGRLSPSDMEVIWEYFDTLLHLANQYKKNL